MFICIKQRQRSNLMKKFLSLVLALVLTMSVAIPSSAALFDTKIYYDANGGDFSLTEQTVFGSSGTITAFTPSKDGSNFLGWATKNNAKSAEYYPGSSISLADSITLYAVWESYRSLTVALKTNDTIEYVGQKIVFKFTPGSTGSYMFSSSGETKLRGVLCKSDGTAVEFDNVAESGSTNFGFACTLTKDATYYLTVQGYDTNTLGDFAVTVSKLRVSTLSFNANGGSGAPASLTGSAIYTIPLTSIPTRRGYTFIGWSEDSKAKSPDYIIGQKITLTKDTTLYAVWSANTVGIPTIEVRNPSTTTISYGDSIILHTDLTGSVPTGATVKWEISGNFTYEISPDTRTCTISPESSGEATITVTLLNASGEPVTELDGSAISDTQTMTSKAGFFDKIIAFFKGIFGLTKVIEE